MLTLVPAYGRDYRSKKEVTKAWNSNKDFTIVSINSQFTGKYCNKRDLQKEGKHQVVMIRYDRLRKVIPLRVDFVSPANR